MTPTDAETSFSIIRNLSQHHQESCSLHCCTKNIQNTKELMSNISNNWWENLSYEDILIQSKLFLRLWKNWIRLKKLNCSREGGWYSGKLCVRLNTNSLISQTCRHQVKTMMILKLAMAMITKLAMAMITRDWRQFESERCR